MSERLAESPRAFVCGWPIHHSRSPLIHGTWLREMGLGGTYERVAVEPERANLFFRELAVRGWAGGNVTIPHKEAAFAAADRCDGAAEAIGAVNTLWFEGGRLIGGNTDAYGFSANLDERLAGWRDATHALVLGAGGAARGVVHALLDAGIGRVTVSNRTPRRAEALADSFGERVRGIGQEAEGAVLSAADLLVNTRPAAPDEANPDLSALPDGALVTDIVYVPLETPVLRAARARGLRCADGLGMLLHQAVPGFERWFGRRPVVTEALRDLVLADIARP
ncbi:shikimate dehydrogenase [Aureimonas jatrophae]|uniref:Shikimate dehydrogenase (NADP(+)) n=1 Tax=Aureimonas jatrophae TaxID=1166073 RepID=A0A1H0K6G5_9HYPH|nr:shikimate dehydrogenase [Aureimonas jatrophae]MBB3950965.1 shikimate dehydrogenase [Aureimonas jatrophae]SDO51340.1 shikimate dehydrogenase [Aureimonas jatrophae]